MGKAKNSFNLSIHSPDPGKVPTSSGLYERIKYGKAKPVPRAINIGSVTNDG